MALPAIEALAARFDLVIHAPAWGQVLYDHVPAAIRSPGRMRADTAVLFAPSLRAAWEARAVPRVIGAATDHRRFLLTDVVDRGPHDADTAARLVAVLGVEPHGPPIFPGRGVPADVPDAHIGLNPVCKGGPTREWPGFVELAQQSDRPVVFYAGPGEERALDRWATGFSRVAGSSLLDFAATLQRCAVFVSNDAGAAHFARAVGVPTVVVHGATTATRTGPHGSIAVEGPDVPCRPCYRSRCAHDFECLAIGVDRVAAAVQSAER